MKKQTIHWEDDICQILKNTCHRISIQNIHRTLKTQRLRNKQPNVKSIRDMKRYSAKEYVQVAWKHTETYSGTGKLKTDVISLYTYQNSWDNQR